MRVGILGSGNVGGTLGRKWLQAGHTVTFGVRDPHSESAKELLAATGPGTRMDSLPDTARDSEVLLLSTPWNVVPGVLESLGDIDGKVIMDATNPLLPRLAGLEFGGEVSGAEKVQEWAPTARIVKAFNCTGYENMADPVYDGLAASLFYCGDDAEAKALVRTLVVDAGFDAVDVGPLKQARLLEPMALLWITMAMQHGFGRGIAFKLLQREQPLPPFTK